MANLMQYITAWNRKGINIKQNRMVNNLGTPVYNMIMLRTPKKSIIPYSIMLGPQGIPFLFATLEKSSSNVFDAESNDVTANPNIVRAVSI